MELDPLIRRAWELQREAAGADVGVPDSIPILYFGDLAVYRRSPVRVVTAALNPSGIEFPPSPSGNLVRFPRATRLAERGYDGSPAAYHAYTGALDEYYRRAPYSRWFDGAYRAILRGLAASFSGDAPNVALHTDLTSPVATEPTWSRLPKPVQRRLFGEGTALWHDLMEVLQPEIVLISVAGAHLDRLGFDLPRTWPVIARVERENPYLVRAAQGRYRSGRTGLFVFGPAAQTPFAFITNVERERIGREVAALARASSA